MESEVEVAAIEAEVEVAAEVEVVAVEPADYCTCGTKVRLLWSSKEAKFIHAVGS